MKNNKKNTGYIIPHTHWDREWRYPIWENRLYLVDMIDELIGTLEADSEYKCFLFDGQVIGIKDYIEVRPQNEQRLKALITDGRIAVGPWYTLPDFYPVCGEALIRNLLKGVREAEKLGKCMYIGYESFGWGQPSQIPQIYKGFGIDTVVVSKNVDKQRAPKCEFMWSGADNTSVLATRLGEDARANFFMNAYIHIMTGKAYKSDEYRLGMGEDGQVYHRADSESAVNDYFKIEYTEIIHTQFIKQSVTEAWNAMKDTLLLNDRAMMDGSDSTTAQPQLTRLLAEINSQFDDIDFKSSSLWEYIDILKAKLDLNSLIEIKGELRDGPSTSLSGNALMTRPHIKSLNKNLQNALFGSAEPFSVINMLLGEKYENEFLNIAINYMLLSHAHDSINGVTQDKTADDVLYMLNQGLEIANVIYNRACQNIIKNIDFSAYNKDDILLVAFNPHPKPRREIITAYIDTPQEQSVWEFSIQDSEGRICEVQHISRDMAVYPEASLHSRPAPFYCDRHCVIFETGEIQAGGYKVFKLCDTNTFNRNTEFWAKMRITNGMEIATSPTHMENEYISVDINANGSVCMLDKNTGNCYDNLNVFESTGDVGDYWIYYPPYNNRTYTSKAAHANIFLMENGNLQATIGVKITMELPAFGYRPDNYCKGKSERSHETKSLIINTYYTLKKGDNKLIVKTEIDNNCKDHRMSAVFETGININEVDAMGHFTVDKRNALPLKDENGYHYNELTTQPMQSYVGVGDNSKGFAVITNCMGEYDVKQDKAGTLSLTLFRAVKNIICTEWRSAGVFPDQEGGQLQQKLTYNYALCLFNNEDLFLQVERFNTPITLAQTCIPNQNRGRLPTTHSFYEVNGGLCVSSIKKAEDRNSVIVRLYNPFESEITGYFSMQDMRSAYSVNLNEERGETLEIHDNKIKVRAPANKIMTFELEVAANG